MGRNESYKLAKERWYATKNWHTIVNVRNGYIKNRQNITHQEPKLFSEYAKGKKKKEKVVINEITEEFPDNDLHYVCYTDGFCDYHTEQRVGSAAYIIVHDGKNHQRKESWTTKH